VSDYSTDIDATVAKLPLFFTINSDQKDAAGILSPLV
jgi:hypothetical protein